MKRYDAKEIKHQAAGQWEHIHSALAPELRKALQVAPRHTACPVHGGKDGFRFFKDFRETGGGTCNTCGHFHDGFSVLQWVNGWSFPQTLEAVATTLGIEAGGIPENRRVHLPDPGLAEHEKRENERRRAILKKTWAETLPITHRLAEALRLYLARRGLIWRDIDTRVVRFHPNLPYYEEREKKGTYPALIALVSDMDGKPVTLHRIYLTPEGFKAPVSAPKKMMPFPTDRSITGGAIRLFTIEHEPLLGVAEGIETALAVQQATGMPTWSCVSATLLESFSVPDEIEILAVWGDQDREKKGRAAGQESTQSLVEKTLASKKRAVGLIPPYEIGEKESSIDWLDVKNRYGDMALPSIKQIRHIAANNGGSKKWTRKILSWMF